VEHIKTVFGTFKDNELIDYNTGEVIKCYPYGIIRERCTGKLGFYNLRRDGKTWTVIQFVEL
jgi:hypothetical protein